MQNVSSQLKGISMGRLDYTLAPFKWCELESKREVHSMLRCRFAEICSCCCLHAVPGPEWVLLNDVLRTILLAPLYIGREK